MKGLWSNLVIYLLPLLACAAVQPKENLGFDLTTSNGLERAGSIYIAPEDEFLYRMRDPNGEYREFERGGRLPEKDVKALPIQDELKKSLLALVKKKELEVLANPHAPDWVALMIEKKKSIYVISGTNVVGGQAQFLFTNGRLTQFEQNGKVQKIPYLQSRKPTEGGWPQYFDPFVGVSKKADVARAQRAPSKAVQRELKKKWGKTGRLRWPFESPNENGFLYLSLALFSTMLFYRKPIFGKVKIPLMPKRESLTLGINDIQLVGGIFFVLSFAMLMLTASRGALLALACGLVPLIAINFKKLFHSKEIRVLGGVVLLMAIVWVAFHLNSFTRGFVKKSRRSNDTRIEMWTTAPRMMVEAPNGWESMCVDKATMAGRAYVDWYDNPKRGDVTGSLINDHLNYLVGYGPKVRFTYLLVWFGLLALMTYTVVRTKCVMSTAVRTKRAVALGVFVALAVASWFNPVLMNIYLWGIPLVAFMLFLASCPWRVWRLRTLCLLFAGAALMSFGALKGAEAYGRRKTVRPYPIFVADGRVCVKDRDPEIWVVDDKKALGRVSACRDIRRYYLRHPSAPAVGYVRRVEDLPRKKIARLVLAGEMGKMWLEYIQKAAEKNEDVSQLFPSELVFISPTFLPSQLPEGFGLKNGVKYIIGEFAARYAADEFADPPAFVTIVPGMELYIENWMDYAMKPSDSIIKNYEECSIYVENGRALVNGDKPNIWIADDGKALGRELACSDIRWYYRHHPSAPAVGYVRQVEKLPMKKVDRLVLAGEMGMKWLEYVQAAAQKGVDVSQILPQELVFVSPTFLPSALPSGFGLKNGVKYIIGEFAARYAAEEFAHPPSFVTIVPGMELYIENWMDYVMKPFDSRSLNYKECSIYVENGQARVNGDDPDIWIVDDGKALGGMLSCSDIRWYYCHHPSAPAVGYVRRVEDLPETAGERLVLAGDAGQKWLDWMQKAADKGQDVRHLVPKELVFISPTFMPSEFPPGIDTVCKVKYVVGEFVTRYHQDEFEDKPEWVTVVPGMELYIKDWMRFAVE